MEPIPSEILALIFSYACTDDGYTGRSLSLVSRYISDVSKPYKLQSVAVRGVWQVLKFACSLGEGRRAEDGKGKGSGSRHLFLSCDKAYDFGGTAWLKRKDSRVKETVAKIADTNPLSFMSNVLRFLHQYLFLPLVGTGQTEADQEQINGEDELRNRHPIALHLAGTGQTEVDAEQINGEDELRNRHSIALYLAFHWILHAVAPTVETLSIACEHTTLPQQPSDSGSEAAPQLESGSNKQTLEISPQVYPIFPRLTELIIAHPRSWPLPNPYECFIQKNCCPSLRRLDLSGVRHYIHPTNLVINIAETTPSITHIHLPALNSIHIK
ncbi:hypothetical protein PILCRDRAFT_6983 [Piloderma croceum F 1598]|uniref:F-box domain-containing protein n=1 Tax=Piloderma croceum (strain F 1598) TaxID=765440 RepID=A0A0C3FZ21_PILCF|nr:hypothetical protein PILCRDRAFT_6983 [Piloderma croceum F 1598]